MHFLKENWGILLLAAVLTVPAVGFVYGMVVCDGCTGITGNLFWRPFIGFVHSFLAISNPSRVPKDEAGVTGFVNLSKYIVPAFVLLAILFYIIKRFIFHKV